MKRASPVLLIVVLVVVTGCHPASLPQPANAKPAEMSFPGAIQSNSKIPDSAKRAMLGQGAGPQ